MEGIREKNKALVRHRDPNPRNMMVVKDTPERVVWIDFDRAEKYDGDQLTAKQKDLFEQEEEVVVDFTISLVSCGPKIPMVNSFLIFINRQLIIRKEGG